VLYYTGISRAGADVIRKQQRRVTELDEGAIARHSRLKNDAVLMKEALLKGNIREVAQVLGRSWGREEKKSPARWTNPAIEQAYAAALAAAVFRGASHAPGAAGSSSSWTDPCGG